MKTAIRFMIFLSLVACGPLSATPMSADNQSDPVNLAVDGALYQHVFHAGAASLIFSDVKFVATGHAGTANNVTAAVAEMVEASQGDGGSAKGCVVGEYCFSFDPKQLFDDKYSNRQKGATSSIFLGL